MSNQQRGKPGNRKTPDHVYDERAHLTLQDRLVKEFRLKGISSIEEANGYAEEFMADYNRRFAKDPRHGFDVHRPLEYDDDVENIFTWRDTPIVTKALTIQFDKG